MHFRRGCLFKLLAPAILFSLVACTNGNQPSAASSPHSLVRPQSSDSSGDGTFFATAAEESFSTYQLESDGDLWPSCWADDDNLYTANGDGKAFTHAASRYDMAVNVIRGMPPSLTGSTIATDVGFQLERQTLQPQADGHALHRRRDLSGLPESKPQLHGCPRSVDRQIDRPWKDLELGQDGSPCLARPRNRIVLWPTNSRLSSSWTTVRTQAMHSMVTSMPMAWIITGDPSRLCIWRAYVRRAFRRDRHGSSTQAWTLPEIQAGHEIFSTRRRCLPMTDNSTR